MRIDPNLFDQLLQAKPLSASYHHVVWEAVRVSLRLSEKSFSNEFANKPVQAGRYVGVVSELSSALEPDLTSGLNQIGVPIEDRVLRLGVLAYFRFCTSLAEACDNGRGEDHIAFDRYLREYMARDFNDQPQLRDVVNYARERWYPDVRHTTRRGETKSPTVPSSRHLTAQSSTVRSPGLLTFAVTMSSVLWAHRGGRKCSADCRCTDYF